MEQIDLTGLGPDEVKLVKQLLEFLRARSAGQEPPEKGVEYHTWPLGVKREITRKDVYDYL